MPAQKRPLGVGGRGVGGDQSYNQRPHREAMARNTSPKGPRQRANVQPSKWDDAGWDQDHDEAAGHRARRLLSNPSSRFHRLGDYAGALRRWFATERWVKRLAVVIAVLMAIFTVCFGGLWWRLGAGPIILRWPRRGWPRRSRKISVTATPSRSAARRSSEPGGSASPCVSAISLSEIGRA